MKKFFTLPLILISSILLAHAAYALFLFPAIRSVEGLNLILNGSGIRKATFLGFHVYEAALYLPKKAATPEEVLSLEGPKQLVLHFVRDVDEEDIVDAWSNGLIDNNQNAERFSAQISDLTKNLGDLIEGQDLIITFNQDAVTLDGPNGLHNIASAQDLPIAVLRIWMGPDPEDLSLKMDLLKTS